ncbi:MAG: hypothetical protein AABM29_02790 [Actinomycetota bacterium]
MNETATRHSTAGAKRNPTIPERIRDLAIMRSAALIWDGEHAYAIVQTPDHVRCLPVGSKAFRRWVQHEVRRQDMKPPSRESLKTAELAIEAKAEEDGGVQPTPSIRVAGRDGEIYLDLGDDDWTCVHVTADGWVVEKHPVDGPYMYRPPRMAALPVPERDGDIGELWRFVNVAGKAERMLLVAAMVQMFWPRGPFPVVAVFGEQGSAKTTTQEMVKSLVDPSRPAPDKHALTSLRKPPRDERDITAAAYGARVIGFDNVSYLDEWLSDAICRLSTGADLGGRELFSDFDEAIISAVRPVMLNGIPEVVGRSDLADRTIKIEGSPPEKRKEEAKLWREFSEARPRLLGALLDLLVIALRRYDDVQVSPEWPDVRMADFARLGEAIGPALGLEAGGFTRIYHANRSEAAREVAELDSLTPRLEELLAARGERWEGSVGELLDALKEGQTGLLSGKGWWSSAKALQTHLVRQVAPLRAVGIQVEKKGRSRSPISNKPRTLYTVVRSARAPDG